MHCVVVQQSLVDKEVEGQKRQAWLLIPALDESYLPPAMF